MEQLLYYVKRKITFLLMGLALAFVAKGQDPTFSLFNLNQIYLNPAYAGATGDLQVGFNSRAQWTHIPSKFNTQTAFVTGGCPKYNLGLGLRFYNDTEGEGYLNTQNVAGLISFHIPARFSRRLNIKGLRGMKNIFSFGMQFAVGQKRLDWTDLVFSDQLHPYLGFYVQESQVNPKNEVSNMVFDIGVGFRWRGEFGKRGSYFSLGAAGFHINTPTETFFSLDTRIQPRYTGHFFTHFQTSKFKNNPHYLSIGWILDVQQVLQSNTLSLSYDVSPNVLLGISYRKKYVFNIDRDFDAIILSAFVNIGNLSFGYSYDFTMPYLGIDATYGTHEIGIVYRFKGTYVCFGKRRKARNIDCYDLDLRRVKRSDLNILQP